MNRRTVPSLMALLILFALGASPANADTIATSSAWLPAVHVTGATGVFRTDVEVFNPNDRPTLVRLYFTPHDRDGRDPSLKGRETTLRAGESISLDDTVLKDFGYSNEYGVLNVEGLDPSDTTQGRALIVTSNTYNLLGSGGTFGQFSPGQPGRNAVPFDRSVLGDLYVTGLPHDRNHRTNLVIINPTNKLLQAGIQLVYPDGVISGVSRFATVQPYSMTQINDLFGDAFAAARPPEGRPYRLTMFVNVDNGAAILGYATVIDLRTGDPYLIPAASVRGVLGGVAAPASEALRAPAGAPSVRLPPQP